MKVLLFIMFFSLCNRTLAELKFESKLVEVQAAPGAKDIWVDFKFTNESNKDVVIKELKTFCSRCLDAKVAGGEKIPQKQGSWIKFKPGESGKIRGKFGIGLQKGKFDRKLGLRIDNDSEGNPSLQLTARIKVLERIRFSLSPVVWKIGENDQKLIDVTVVNGPKLNLTFGMKDKKKFEADFVEIEKGRKYQLKIRPKLYSTAQICLCFIYSDSEYPRYSKKRLYLKVE